MYKVQRTAFKGFTLVATASIPRGTRIFSEQPLLSLRTNQDSSAIYAAFQQLPHAARNAYLQLSSAHLPLTTRILRASTVAWWTLQSILTSHLFSPHEIKETLHVLNIFRTNAFSLTSRALHSAVFPHISRINHSCLPNTFGIWNDAVQRFTVHAVREVEVGEELSLNYLHETGATRDVRQRQLEPYGFVCNCPACDIEGDNSPGKIGEEKRRSMQEELREHIVSIQAVSTQPKPQAELKVIESYVQFFEAERVAGRELAVMYSEGARLQMVLENPGAALIYAKKALAIDHDCLGSDHALCQRDAELVADLEASIASRIALPQRNAAT